MTLVLIDQPECFSAVDLMTAISTEYVDATVEIDPSVYHEVATMRVDHAYAEAVPA